MDNSQGVPAIKSGESGSGQVKDGDLGSRSDYGMPPINSDLGTRPYDGSDKSRGGNGALLPNRSADHGLNMNDRVAQDKVANPMDDSQD